MLDLNAILDELEEATLGARPQGDASAEASRSIRDYYHYEEYKKRFKVLIECCQLEELLKSPKGVSLSCYDSAPMPVPRVLP